MSDPSINQAAQEVASFQKALLEGISKSFQAAFNLKPDSAPPEVLRQIRAGMFQALTDSWDQFMRSPQFLQSMRQWTENAATLRTMTDDFLARMRNEAQAPSRSDIDTVMLTVRHMEKRLLDRLDGLSMQMENLQGAGASTPLEETAAKPGATRHARRKTKKRGSHERRQRIG
jgi:uncharacterized protein (DUF2267 family)